MNKTKSGKHGKQTDINKKKGRPIPVTTSSKLNQNKQRKPGGSNILDLKVFKQQKEEEKPETIEDTTEHDNEMFKAEAERFVEISKYFSSPLHRTASYICESSLVSFPNPFRIVFKRGGVTAHTIKFTNLILEPVYIKQYKLIPDLEQIKYINLSLSRCKRIPPGLSFNLGFVYDDVNERESCNAKMIFVASRKTTTPCYQICEIELIIQPTMKQIRR